MAHRIIFLAPPGTKPGFGSTKVDPERWRSLLFGACKVRGSAYLEDGAIQQHDLHSDGSFRLPMDDNSWHVLMVDDDDQVTATLRATVLPLDSRKRKGKLPHVGASLGRAESDQFRPRFKAELFLSTLGLVFGSERTQFMVVGGWASDRHSAPPSAGAELALSVWAFSRHTEVAGALCVASERHDAHGQLVRTGAVPIRAIGSQDMYFDSAYGCRVGLLGFRVFQERRAVRRFVDQLATKIAGCEIVMFSEA